MESLNERNPYSALPVGHLAYLDKAQREASTDANNSVNETEVAPKENARY
ncbi:MAG: hypothetical protein R3Y10_02290 [Ferrimonas sp.]